MMREYTVENAEQLKEKLSEDFDMEDFNEYSFEFCGNKIENIEAIFKEKLDKKKNLMMKIVPKTPLHY